LGFGFKPQARSVPIQLDFDLAHFPFINHQTMKISSTTILLIAATAFAPAAHGREAMLGVDRTGQERRLYAGRYQKNWADIYYRCCDIETKDGDEWPECKCPKRTSQDAPPSWAASWLGEKTYAARWEEQCSEGGWLYKKAHQT
jgi:hypothetical protein